MPEIQPLPGIVKPERPIPPTVKIHLRGLDVTIVPDGISEVTTESTASFETLFDRQGKRIGQRINEDPRLNETVPTAMKREIGFQFSNALDVLTGEKEAPPITKTSKKREESDNFRVTPQEAAIIKGWIGEKRFILKDRPFQEETAQSLQAKLKEIDESARAEEVIAHLKDMYVRHMVAGKLSGTTEVTIDNTFPYSAHLHDVTAVAFPLWSTAAPLLEEFAAPLASALFAVTRDKKLIFNVRQLKNANWKKVGGGIAGMMSHVTDRPTLADIDKQMKKEGVEEAGLTQEDLSYPRDLEHPDIPQKSRVVLLGYAHATTQASENRPRWEGLGYVVLPENSNVVRRRVATAEQSLIGNSRQDFAEGDVRFFKANSRTIEKLVQFESYWPTTHLAGLLAVGFRFKREELEKKGIAKDVVYQQVSQWVEDVAKLANTTYDRIDTRVQQFYLDEANKQLLDERIAAGKNVKGYDPTIPPSDVEDPKHPGQIIPGQGLPSVDEEIQRLFRPRLYALSEFFRKFLTKRPLKKRSL